MRPPRASPQAKLGATNVIDMLDCGNLGFAIALGGEQMLGKFRAARDMKKSILGAGPFRIVFLFQVAGVVEKDGQHAELEEGPGQHRRDPGRMAPLQQPHHAERALQRMLEVVIMRIDRLIILIFARKTIDRPAKSPRNDQPICVGEHAPVDQLDLVFNGRRVLCIDHA